MLAKPTKAITEVLDRFEGKDFTCEYKYDGERAQVHMLQDKTIAVFSRNSENMSAKYPDLVEHVPRVRRMIRAGLHVDGTRSVLQSKRHVIRYRRGSCRI